MNFRPDGPSPLDGLRYQKRVMQDADGSSSSVKVNSFNFFSLQDGNPSALSFETVLTTERLLDKLELSNEDELLLQALNEEEEKQKEILRKQAAGPTLCMPASAFTSLRSRSLTPSRELHSSQSNAASVTTTASSGYFSIKGNSSSSEVQRHFCPDPRYSYVVEEDHDLEELSEDEIANQTFPQMASQKRGNVLDLEKFRVGRKSNNPNKHENGYLQKSAVLSSPGFTFENLKKVGDKKYDQQLLPRKWPSSESDSLHSSVSAPKDENCNSYCMSTPPRKTTSSSTTLSNSKESSSQHDFTYKAHKKKSSFSLKNLFKSPKSAKSIAASELASDTTDGYYKESLKESGSVSSTPLRKYIFPINPIVKHGGHLKVDHAHDEPVNHSIHHQRSVSDYQQDSKKSSANGSNGLLQAGRKLSLDDSTPNDSSISPNVTNIERSAATAGSVGQDTYENSIQAAIDMRNEGRLRDSSEQLRKACQMGNKTAYLLYGLALRHGYGVERDYVESFKHIYTAAGIISESREIFGYTIDPFELEKTGNIPDIVAEPLVPALYECGISYLKGYGVQIDEVKGLKYLEKAASLGHLDSMCLSGTMWSKKTLTRKKDIARAASWFRLAASKGANLIASEWIYKPKYMLPSANV